MFGARGVFVGIGSGFAEAASCLLDSAIDF